MVLVSKTKRPTTIRTKRRQGHHHKKDERYMRPYWPYIPLLLIVAVGLVFSNLWGGSQKGVLGYATEMSATNLLSGTNNQRAANSLGNLALNSKLTQAAQAKANDMAARNYWSHNTPDGATPWTFFVNAGYNYKTAGENLAYGFDTSDYAITAWMNSPEHKANILGNYTEVGFGVANSPDYQGTGPETIVVAEYGTPQSTAAAPAPAAAKPKAATPASPVQQTPAPVAEATPEAAATPTENKTEASKETAATAAAGVKKDAVKTVTTQNVSRIQLLTNGQAAWSTFVVTMFATVCIGVFILRHGLFWHRTLVKGEKFFIHHKVLDGVLVAIAVVGFVLTRTAGVIH